MLRIRWIAVASCLVLLIIGFGILRTATDRAVIGEHLPTPPEEPPVLNSQEQPLLCPLPEFFGFSREGRLLQVPQNYPTIQAAIDAAPDGATIQIAPGTYQENLVIRKSLTLQAVEEQVVIKSATESLPTLLVVSGRPIQVGVIGLTLLPARQHQGNGIEIMGTVAARIERNTIQDYKWGILVLGKTEGAEGLDPSEFALVISENMIQSGIAIVQSANVIISKNSIQNNTDSRGTSSILIGNAQRVVVSENLVQGGSGFGISVSQSFAIEITSNLIQNNGLGLYAEGSYVDLRNNQIEQNGFGVTIGTKGPLESKVSVWGNRITQLSLAAGVSQVANDQLTVPGQPQPVTVRFAPTAAGSFNGSAALTLSGTCVRWSDVVLDRGPSQCLEQSVAQGSLNMQLAGTAYSIAINPPQLEFGLLFVGTSRQEKLTIKNEGTTTVTIKLEPMSYALAVHINPFEITLPPENPVALKPGASVEVTVRFRSTASGVYESSIKLISGPLTKEITIGGLSLTLEEFMEKLKGSGYPILYTENSHGNLGMLFSGIGDLSLSKIRHTEGMYEFYSGNSNEDMDKRWEQIVYAIKLLQRLNPNDVSNWFTQLQRALTERGESGFRTEYDNLFSSHPDFSKFVAVSLLMQGKIPLEVQLDQVDWKDIITRFFAGLAQQIIIGLINPVGLPPGKDAITWTLQWNLRERYKTYVGWDSFKQAQWREFEFALDTFVIFFIEGKMALKYAIYTIAFRIIQTAWKTGTLSQFTRFLEWALLPSDQFMNALDRQEQAIGTIYALAAFARAGWHMHGFIFSPNLSWASGLAFFPRVPGFDKGIVLVLRGDHCTDCGAKVSQIVEWVRQAIYLIQNSRPQDMFGALGPYKDSQRIITLIFTNSNATGIPTIINKLQQNFSASDIPIVMIYFEKQGDGSFAVKLECFGQKCKELRDKGVLEKIRSDYARALQIAMKAYPGMSPEAAWHLAYAACMGDPDCIKFIAESIEKELKKCTNLNGQWIIQQPRYKGQMACY